MRVSARAVLLDGEDRLLLLRGHDPDDPTRDTFWFTVGGGMEPGESAEAALRREAQEEVGLEALDVGPLLWTHHTRFRLAGRDFDQENLFFLARTDTTATDDAGQEDVEREIITGVRWWTLDELRTTTDELFPPRLADLLADLLQHGPPPEPVALPRD